MKGAALVALGSWDSQRPQANFKAPMFAESSEGRGDDGRGRSAWLIPVVTQLVSCRSAEQLDSTGERFMERPFTQRMPRGNHESACRLGREGR